MGVRWNMGLGGNDRGSESARTPIRSEAEVLAEGEALKRMWDKQAAEKEATKKVEVTPDVADIALRDAMSGRVRRARGGSTASALGQFSPTSALGRDSILGGY